MPTYVYSCTECDHRFEAQQAFSDNALTECPNCGGKLRKVFNSVGIVFKGSGFYRTDSRGKSPESSSSSDSAKSSDSSKGSDSKGSDSAKSADASKGSDSKGSESKGSDSSKKSDSAAKSSSSSSTSSAGSAA